MEEVLYVSPGSMTEEYANKLSDALNIFKWQLGSSDTVIKGPDTISSLYNIITYDEYLTLDPNYYRFRTVSKRWYILFKDEAQFTDALSSIVRKVNKYYWTRFRENDLRGYEVTSKGDKRFSPLFMRLNDVTLEEYYHLDIKGYRSFGYTDWREVKGKEPLYPLFFEHEVEQSYKDYLYRYPSLLYELAIIGSTQPLTDMFDVNGGQNKIYTKILNEYYGLI